MFLVGREHISFRECCSKRQWLPGNNLRLICKTTPGALIIFTTAKSPSRAGLYAFKDGCVLEPICHHHHNRTTLMLRWYLDRFSCCICWALFTPPHSHTIQSPHSTTLTDCRFGLAQPHNAKPVDQRFVLGLSVWQTTKNRTANKTAPKMCFPTGKSDFNVITQTHPQWGWLDFRSKIE